SPNTEATSPCTPPCYGPGRTGGSAKRRSAGGRESPVRWPSAASAVHPAASGLLARHEPVPLARHAAVAPRDGCRLARQDAALALPARPAAVEPLVPERA